MRAPRFGVPMAAAVAALALGLLATPASTQDLRLAVSSPISSVDPHYQNLVPNLAVSQHIFDALLVMSNDSKIRPALAESITALNPTTWEVKLRKGVKFHNGSDLTAEDVVWSLDRPATLTKSPAPFTIYTRAIVEKKIIDASTIHLITKTPYPLLPNDLPQVFIMSKKAAEKATTEDLNQGTGMIGTGPYKLVKYAPGDNVEFARFDGYWGGKPSWDKVTYRFIGNDSSRVAALLAGDVDAIDQVPTADLARIKADAKLTFQSVPSLRVIYMYVDAGREQTPFVTAKDGSPLTKNPLKDERVRRALSMAINREAIRDRVMEGMSFPSSQFIPPSLYDGDTPPQTAFDLDGAKKLLAAAGYADGFGLTIHGPNNRFPNDARIVEAIAQMFTRIGIAAKIETMPMGPYATRGAKGDFSFGLIGWGAQTGDISSTLRGIIACENKERGWGAFNWSRYCNPKVDDLLAKALEIADATARNAMLREAAKLAASEGAILPVHFQLTSWAARKGIVIEGRSDERTLAMGLRVGL